MRYSLINRLDVVNGEGIGISLFVQGCHFHCKNCFNQVTWDFNGGKEWNDDICNQFLNLANRPQITRISILGGEPLADENVSDILQLIQKIRYKYGNTKQIWLYTGYVYEGIINNVNSEYDILRKKAVLNSDVVVDGRYIDELNDLTLAFRGSSNQRIIKINEQTEVNV